jgi:hypothetical protein
MSGEAAYILQRGDETAGAVIVKHLRPDGTAVVYARRYDIDGDIIWERATGEAPVVDKEADAYIDRRVKSDADLWAVEVESRADAPPLTDL